MLQKTRLGIGKVVTLPHHILSSLAAKASSRFCPWSRLTVLLGPALNGITDPKARSSCVEPWTFKSIEFYTWIPLGYGGRALRNCCVSFSRDKTLRDCYVSFPKRTILNSASVGIRAGDVTFPVYDTDFGWGEPAWVGSAKWLYKNLVTFLDTKLGNGIEVWINLDEEDMSKFEVDKELLAYVSSVKLSTWLSWIDNQGWGKNGLLSVFAIFFFFNVYFKFYISLKWGEVSQCSSSMRSSLSHTMLSICVDLIWGEMVVSWDCKMIFLLVCNIICLFHGIKRRNK